MIPGPAVVDNKFSDTQIAEAATINSNITTGIILVTTIADEAPEVVIDEESEIVE